MSTSSIAPQPVTRVSRPLRLLAALPILAFGVVHLLLWRSEYHEIKVIGVLFLLNFIAAVVVAAALATRPIGAFALGGIGLSLLTLVAFTLSRIGGLFGFTEKEFSELPAVLAAFAELGTIVASGLWHWASCSATSAALAKPATATGGPST